MKSSTATLDHPMKWWEIILILYIINKFFNNAPYSPVSNNEKCVPWDGPEKKSDIFSKWKVSSSSSSSAIPLLLLYSFIGWYTEAPFHSDNLRYHLMATTIPQFNRQRVHPHHLHNIAALSSSFILINYNTNSTTFNSYSRSKSKSKCKCC